jgi:hypothetical protein
MFEAIWCWLKMSLILILCFVPVIAACWAQQMKDQVRVLGRPIALFGQLERSADVN